MSALTQLPPASADVFCQGRAHRLRWADGTLIALDHDDVDGEITLHALGGDVTACAEIVSDWQKASSDLRVLILAPRGGADQLTPAPPDPQLAGGPSHPAGTGGFGAGSSFGWFAYAPLSPTAMSATRGMTLTSSGQAGLLPGIPGIPGIPGMPRPDPLATLLRLPGGLPQRLVATVLSTWATRLAAGLADPGDLPALTAALVGRARIAVQSWLGDPGAKITVTMLEPGAAPTFEMADGEVSIGLSFSWLADVWAPGLTHLLGRFTLGAAADGERLTLDTVSSALELAPLVIAPG